MIHGLELKMKTKDMNNKNLQDKVQLGRYHTTIPNRAIGSNILTERIMDIYHLSRMQRNHVRI